jgi:hypothetical protein
MSLPPRSCFQFFGLDFLVDDAGAPWLLEVNATPSMKVGAVAAGRAHVSDREGVHSSPPSLCHLLVWCDTASSERCSRAGWPVQRSHSRLHGSLAKSQHSTHAPQLPLSRSCPPLVNLNASVH